MGIFDTCKIFPFDVWENILQFKKKVERQISNRPISHSLKYNYSINIFMWINLWETTLFTLTYLNDELYDGKSNINTSHGCPIILSLIYMSFVASIVQSLPIYENLVMPLNYKIIFKYLIKYTF